MRRLGMVLCAAHVVAASSAFAAFEFDGFDPAVAGRSASGPAWPMTARPFRGTPPLFGAPRSSGVTSSAVRFAAAPELKGEAAAAWKRVRGGLVEVEALRLGLDAYAETTFRMTVARPAETGWAWAVIAGLETWRAGAYGAAQGALSGGLGYAPRPGLRLGLALAASRLDLGLTLDPRPGFRLGAGYETVPNATLGRLRAGAEVIAARGVVLRLGFVPDTGFTSLGIAAAAKGIDVDVARRDHPRLGASLHLGVTFAPAGTER